MENFTYSWPTKIIFGEGTENQAGEETAKLGKRVLLHYGTGSIRKTGLYDRIVASLKKAGVEFVELPGVVPNPRIELVREGIGLCRKENLDFILAAGGGSVIDSAKAVAAGVHYPGDPWDFFEKKIPVEKALPIGVILTIPAAGSEGSAASVITSGNRKLSFYGDLLRPRFAILNPELTKTLPPNQTAAGIADMIAHIVERYFTNTQNVDLTDKLCEATLRSIIKNARVVMKDPDNYACRAEIMWASTIAHQGFLGNGREEDWASHKIEHELSAHYDVTHGAGLAVIIPAWMKYVHRHDEKRFRQFAREVFGKGSALEGIEALEAFFRELGLPSTLRELNIGEEKLEQMADLAARGGSIGNFVKLRSRDVLGIYRLALG